MPRAALTAPLLAAFAAAFAACSTGGGGPITYLRLAPVPARHALPGVRGAVSVATVELPPSIDRIEFTAATGPETMQVSAQDHWAGPLGDMMRTVLAQDLASRLPRASVLMPGDPLPPGGVREVHVGVQVFMPDARGTVRLQADWWISATNGGAVQRRGRFDREVPGAPKPAPEASTMSVALGWLADEIARGLAATAPR